MIARISLLILLSFPSALFAADIVPLPRAHSHNDYMQGRPLRLALSLGFGSVEADIHLRNGELLIGHDEKDLVPGRTLQTLYLDPLKLQAEKNKGHIYPGAPPIILLVDIKTEAAATYSLLKEVLEKYRPICTEFTPDGPREKAITVILSGNRPIAQISLETNRLCALDGRLPNIGAPPHLYPLISSDWKSQFKWDGKAEMTSEELTRLRGFIAQAHASNHKLRFWGSPDNEKAWKLFHELGLDLINTDHLSALARFLSAKNKL